MSSKIKVQTSVLFEHAVKALSEKYARHVSKDTFVTSANINTFYNKVPTYIFEKPKYLYIPSMYRIFRKGENRYFNKRITESIIKYPKTLSFNKVHELLIKEIFVPDNFIITCNLLDNNNIPGHIHVSIPVKYIRNNVVEHLSELMHLCGYYLAYRDAGISEDGTHVYWWQFEPYYYTEVRETLNDTIYHVTNIENISNIKQAGLIVSHNPNSLFNYPPRNYFFNNADSIAFKAYAKTADKINDKNEFGVVFANTLKTNAIYFTDPNYIEKHGIYTYDNINNNAITNIIIEQL